MAYCKKCGAYIPDGLSACLACGYDENADAGQGTAAKQNEENENYRIKYEEERRRRQEENLRWAEQERARMEEEERRRREELERRERERERIRRETEEEYARRQEERERAREEERLRRSRAAAYRSASDYAASSAGKNKVLAALSYLSVLFVLPRIFCPEDRFARYHARQGLTLFIFGIICDAISAAFPVGWVLTLFRIYCIFKGMSNALNEKEEPLPFIGKYGEKQD